MLYSNLPLPLGEGWGEGVIGGADFPLIPSSLRLPFSQQGRKGSR